MRGAVAFFVASVLTACGGSEVPVPRDVAYPRIVEYGEAYVAADSLPLTLEVNAATIVTRPREGWVDVAYPAYHATVHITITPAAGGEMDEAVANRLERMALNAGSAPAVRESVVSDGGFEGVVLTAGEPVSTPVQFVAADGRYVVSGAAFFRDWTPATPADSVAPMVEVVRRDILKMVKALK